ncbi:MAG: extracellular solute-binding protein [Oscillospiraceae bacterium]|nr:extracellular solute-binding protein [Oscillospiraceae bacterium]
MKRSVSCILLVLVMLLSMLAGCGESNQSAASANTSAAAEENETTAPADVPAAPASGEEASTVMESAEPTHTIEYPVCEPGEVTLTYWMQWPPFLNGQYEPAEVPFFAAMEEATGVHLDITYCSTEVVSDQLQLMTASDSYTDLLQGAATYYPGGGSKAVEDEMLLDLYPLMEENMPNYWSYMQDPAVSKQVVNDQGYVPMLSGIYSDYYYTDQGLWVRQDWLDDLGMDKPETLDQFLEMLKSFKSEKGASEPFTLLGTGVSEPLGASFGTNPNSVVVEDGQVAYGPVTDGTKEYLKLMNQMYNEGLISSDFVSYTESETKPPEDVVLTGKTGVFNEDVAAAPSYTNNVEGMDLRALQAPVQNAGDKLDIGPVAALVSSQYNISVSTACENPEMALQYIDYLFSEEGMVLANWGTEGQTYDVVDGEKVFKDEILNDPMGFQVGLILNICPGFIRMIDWDVTYLSYNDAQKEAVDIWTSVFASSDMTFPKDYVTYTSDESETIAELESGIETYCEECRLKFIVGDMDIESEWDTYTAAVENMGLAELLEIYQGAYERYMAR